MIMLLNVHGFNLFEHRPCESRLKTNTRGETQHNMKSKKKKEKSLYSLILIIRYIDIFDINTTLNFSISYTQNHILYSKS